MNSETTLQKNIFNGPMIGIAITLYIVTACALLCCGLDKKVPVNYGLLLVFTLCVSYLVAGVCCVSNPVVVFEAAGLTAAVTVGLTYYAITTKNDFTLCGPLLYTLGMLFIFSGLFVFMYGPSLQLFYCVIGVFLYSFYIVFDTQQIIGGKKTRYQISEDSYVIASVMLYLDIIGLFLEILRILGE
jgi:FtsH-binding integral membrane protein